MVKAFGVLAFALLSLLMLSNAYAYYNITYVNTTVVLNNNQSAHVVEQFTLYVSNSSISQYLGNRNAVGVGLSYWQNILFTNQLTEHIIGAGHSISGFAFLPGPLTTAVNGSIATLTMNYYVNNVTDVLNIAPRKFEYTFNDTLFNFESTANGQTLPGNTRLNIIIPRGSSATTLYPLPDSPKLNFIGNYTNVTAFSWYSGEPLRDFSFQYITTQGLQQEVLAYLKGIYANYALELYLALAVVVVILCYYVYTRIMVQER